MEQTIPVVFISYSWSSDEHNNWVINLAERLTSDGVEVKIDQWDLREGHDLYSFMESMVTSKEVSKVLLILDKNYTHKSNNREGGVGTETQIISPEVYNKTSQEKFIPIVVERDNNDEPYIPVFLKNRIFIDFSKSDAFEENYDKLLRNLYKRPLKSRPKLGNPPSHIFKDTPNNPKITSIIRNLNQKIEQNPSSLNSHTRKFFNEFYQSLSNYSLKIETNNPLQFGKEIIDNLNSFLPLRNEYISFLEVITVPELNLEFEVLSDFLEKLPRYFQPLDDSITSWKEIDYDNFRFITHEFFLNLIMICIRNKNYSLLSDIFYSHYFIETRYNNYQTPKSFSVFHNNIESINNFYNEAYTQNYCSPMADLLIKRVSQNYSTRDFVEADLLCHYVASLNEEFWFPLTYVYIDQGSIRLFDRLQSKKHFEKFKVVFDVDNIDELEQKLLSSEKNTTHTSPLRYSNTFNRVTPIHQAIDIKKVAILK